MKKEVDLEKLPDPGNHQLISFIKSCMRIISCIFGMFGLFGWAFFGLILAEVVGIFEELV